MLVRIRGAQAGIAYYLRTGKKKGRAFTRDELDERVSLLGDIDALEVVLCQVRRKGDKYLHIVLAFKEDLVPIVTLREIAREFRDFLAAAYGPEELMVYAEAHLPKMKSLVEPLTREVVERKPHIHVVVPRWNLATGSSTNPLGRVTRVIHVIDAFQEVVNARFGLVSPKESRRNTLSDRSDVLSRMVGDEFEGAGKEMKAQILATILERNIVSTVALMDHLRTLGEVRIRNADGPLPYFNLKLPGAAKGLNLKHACFGKEFLGLTLEMKRSFLGQVDPGNLLTPGPPRAPDPKAVATLEWWFRQGACEVKYMNNSSRAQWAQYAALSESEKVLFLDSLEAKRTKEIQQMDDTQAKEGIGPSVQAVAPKNRPDPDGFPRKETSLGQATAELVDAMLDRLFTDRLPRSPRSFDVAEVYRRLLPSHGLNTDRFQGPLLESANEGAQGLYRFLRTALHKSPFSSWSFVKRMDLVPPNIVFAQVPSDASRQIAAHFRRKRKELEEEKELLEAKRKAELSVLQMSLVLARRHLWLTTQLESERTRPETSQEVENGVGPARNSGEPEAAPSRPASHSIGKWSHEVRRDGSVDYLRDGVATLQDVGPKVIAKVADQESVDVLLRLAVEKYGQTLHIFGTTDFKSLVVRRAAQMRNPPTFDEPELQLQLKKSIQILDRGR